MTFANVPDTMHSNESVLRTEKSLIGVNFLHILPTANLLSVLGIYGIVIDNSLLRSFLTLINILCQYRTI